MIVGPHLIKNEQNDHRSDDRQYQAWQDETKPRHAVWKTAGRSVHRQLNRRFEQGRADNSVAPGIGHRLDEWANRDLNVRPR